MKIEEWRIAHHTHCNRRSNECEHYHLGMTMGVDDTEEEDDGRTGETTATTGQGSRGSAKEARGDGCRVKEDE